MSDEFAQWLERNPPPDLQALAERYGGLGRVPAEAWQFYDEALAEWQRKYRSRAHGGGI